jgi:hypothetical protein
MLGPGWVWAVPDRACSRRGAGSLARAAEATRGLSPRAPAGGPEAGRLLTVAADLGEVLRLAGAGVFPPVDGGWERDAPWRAGVEAVVALTGHAYLAVGDDVSDADLAALRPDGLGGAHHPRVVSALAGQGWIDVLDALLVGTGGGRPLAQVGLEVRHDLAAHSRAAFAAALRDDVQVLGRAAVSSPSVLGDGSSPGASLVTVSRGIGGLTELGVEVTAGTDGARLVADALASRPAGETVVAAVAPGNARALRAFLRAGFRPVGSVQVYRPQR